MPYCVKCGVKLEAGAKMCPLCGTKVLTEEIEKPEVSLFQVEKQDNRETGLGKQKKSIVEITLLMGVITEFVVALSISFPLAWYPIITILYAEIGFFIAFTIAKPTYFKIASLETLLLMFFIVALDYLIAGDMTWSYIVCISLWIFWSVAVFPAALTRKKVFMFIEIIISLIIYLFLLDYANDEITWAIKVGLPVVGCFGALWLIFIGLLQLKKAPKPKMADYVNIGLSIFCLTISFGDWSYFSFTRLSWSKAFWFVGMTFFVFELLLLFSKKIRRYFYSANRHD